MSDKSLRTRIAFYSWLTLLLASLATFAIGISGHIVALLAGPWLSLKTQAFIHGGIPVFLTAVKFVTVPLLVALTPFASHHPTFEHWTDWSKEKFRQLENLAKGPFRLAKKSFCHAWAMVSGRGSGCKQDGNGGQEGSGQK
jgi:hypothetical protein